MMEIHHVNMIFLILSIYPDSVNLILIVMIFRCSPLEVDFVAVFKMMPRL